MTQEVPQHIAIIMDGNGRWAQARGLPRTAGHQQGIEACKRVVRAAGEAGIKYLTLFGLSTENWSRPAEEINELMRLLRMYLRSETAELHRNNVQLRVIGDKSVFSNDIIELIDNAENLTKDCDGQFLTIALNYGGRAELVHAASQAAQFLQSKNLDPSQENFEEYMGEFLMTKGLPDPDILIRTSGEKRISNFLLWQCAYTELFFSETYWPDFDAGDLDAAIECYSKRERRFGAIKTS